jgi:predicted Zn-dependent protease
MKLKRAAIAALSLTATGIAMAQPAPQPSVPQQVAPQDKDERGLWMLAEEEERKFANSNFVIRDPALNDYVRSVFCKTVGEEQCEPVRIYIMRTPEANAMMMPNGAMQVWSGLFLRVRDEAQLAAVLGHEFTHFRERHGVRIFRDMREKMTAATWFAFVPFGFVAQLGLGLSIFSYSRDMERDADMGSVRLIAAAGYEPLAASRFWEQSRAEMDATAAARGTRSRKDKNGGLFATHPRSGERMKALAELAARQPAGERATHRDSFQAALKPWWGDLISDQIKRNDFGGTELLLGELARDGWTAELLYARGELYRMRGRPDDFIKATEFYRQAVAMRDAPDQAWRGLGLALLRSGASADGKLALREYLTRQPKAGDHDMIAMLAGDS